MTERRTLGRGIPRWLLSIVLLPSLQFGCSGPGDAIPGGMGNSTSAGGSGASPALTATGGGGAQGSGGAPVVPGSGGGFGAQGTGGGTVAPAVDAPSPGYVRRLTHLEFDNTVADLLGVDLNSSANFETDLAQDGFTNNAAAQNVSPTLAEQYVVATEAISEAATQNLPQLLGCDPSNGGGDACVKQFITNFGKKAWRRPLSVEEEGRLFALFTGVRAEFDLAPSVQMLLQVFLLSPQFIYLLEPNPVSGAPGAERPLGPWELASRLSYFLLGSMPDDELFLAAETGGLDTAEGVAVQARRLLSLPRARERIGLFYTEWLRLRNIERMQKDGSMFPTYDLSVAPLMLEQVSASPSR